MLAEHGLSIALVHPQIAPNTGNIARLCVAAGSHLHLVRPMGFVLSDREIKRSAMDYWPRLSYTLHDDLDAFLVWLGDRRPWLMTTQGTVGLWDCPFQRGDVLVFGNEGAGLPDRVHKRFSGRGVRIPQMEGERCLNLSTAAGVALYEGLRKCGGWGDGLTLTEGGG